MGQKSWQNLVGWSLPQQIKTGLGKARRVAEKVLEVLGIGSIPSSDKDYTRIPMCGKAACTGYKDQEVK